jgi:uncharacterized protein Yka (UPF0111/DUF47 family)
VRDELKVRGEQALRDLEARGRRIVEKFEKQVGRLADARNPIGSSHLDASELTARVHQLERRIDQLERDLRDMIEQPGA